MSSVKLTYFDFAGSRGEECRLALTLAGVDFEDVRIKGADWPALKPNTPFGSLPVLEIEGHAPIAQANTILRLIGRKHDLHPSDPFEAARHESLMGAAEDLRHLLSATMRITDEEQKKAVRSELAAGPIPRWAASIERQLGEGPFVGGERIQVADLKFFTLVKWLRGGVLDHVPTTVLDDAPRLIGVHDAVAAHPRVVAWYAR